METTNLPVAVAVNETSSEHRNLPIAYVNNITNQTGQTGQTGQTNPQNIPIAQSVLVTEENPEEDIPEQQVSRRSRERIYPYTNGVAELIQSYLQNDFVATDNMVLVWDLAKTIRCFTMIDLFFCLLYFFIKSIYAVAAIFPILGYWGAKYYNVTQTVIYATFILANLVLRFYTYTLIENYVTFLFCLLGMLFELWILYNLYHFIKKIRNLDILELTQLRDPLWHPVQSDIIQV